MKILACPLSLFSVLVSLLLPFAANAQTEPTFRWDLQVTDPDFELVNYKLDDKSFKPYLKKTSWRCEASKKEVNGPRQMRKLHCDYSVEKAGTVTTIVSCSQQRPYSEGFLELFDERKGLTFQVMLTCRKVEGAKP